MKQLSHHEIHNVQKSFPIIIVCDAIRTPENIGMCFRIAESFGVAKIFTHNSSPSLDNRIVQRTARNTIATVTHETYKNFEDLIKQLKVEGNTIIGLEITNASTAIQDYDFSIHKKIVLLLGSERYGIKYTTHIDHTISIPMYGKNSSMNVIHSLAITLYEVTNQFNNAHTLN